MGMSFTWLRHTAAAALAGSLVAMSGLSAQATGYGGACNASQGFHYTSGNTSTVGYLLSATIAGTTLAADFSVYNPGTKVTTNVVGVISSDSWTGNVTDPIQVTAYVSGANRQRLASLSQQALTNAAVTFNFANYAWDPQVQTYYESFGPASPPLRGQVQTSNGTPNLQVASTPGPVASPQNYQMSMAVVPASGGSQPIRVAFSSQSPAIKSWGM